MPLLRLLCMLMVVEWHLLRRIRALEASGRVALFDAVVIGVARVFVVAGFGLIEHGVGCVLGVVLLFCTHGINLGRTELYWTRVELGEG